MNEDLQIQYEIDLEREWKGSLPRFSDKELLDIFPEAKECLSIVLKNLKTQEMLLETKIKIQLAQVKHRKSSEMAIWFVREIIKWTIGIELYQLQQRIKRIERLLIPEPECNDQRFSEKVIEQARQVPIQQFIDTPIFQWNNRLKTNCPLHDDSKPSFVVYQDQNTCWCFGCQQGGDVINFIQLLHGCTFPQAIKFLTQ